VAAFATDRRTPPRRNDRTRAHARSLRRGNRRVAEARHVRPSRRPLRARLRRLKRRARSARPRPRLRSLNDPVPYRVSVTATRPEPRARETRPSKGAITDQWPRDLLGESRRHRCPRIRRITDQQLEGQLGHEPTNPSDVPKMGAPSCHLATTLLIGGSKPDPRRVRTGALDQQSQ
jgi:hypothetical protein